LVGGYVSGAIAAAIAHLKKPKLNDARLQLLVFALTPILIVSIQAFISRAHANWAAASYPAAVILVTAFLFQSRRDIIARANLGFHAVLAALLLILMTNFGLLEQIGAGRAVNELRGWAALSDQIAEKADGYDAVLFDDRSMIGEMLYYQRGKGFEIAALDPNNGVDHHYEAFLAFKPDEHKRSLFVSILGTDAHVNYRFRNVERVGVVEADIGEARRRYTLFEISDYYGPATIQYTD
jgi:hypothetical protein